MAECQDVFRGNFVRKPPAQFAKSTPFPLGWFAVNLHYVSVKSDRRKLHGEWFEISAGSNKIYRMLRFSTGLKKNDHEEEIVLDWIGWLNLFGRDDDVKGPIRLTCRRLSWRQRPWAYLKHPDPAVRLSGWLGWASVILGVFALILTPPVQALFAWIVSFAGKLGGGAS